MPTPIPPGLVFAILAPDEAIAAFRRRDLLPSFAWEDVWQEEHARAFTVAKLLRMDLLQFVRDELDRAIAEGTPLAEFVAALRPRLAEAGWWGTREVIDPATGQVARTTFDLSRLRLIYDVNLRQSYAAGRWQRIESAAEAAPDDTLIYYRTMRDERVRQSHRAWDGVALPAGHPFWRTHYPPNGWRCRCVAYAVTRAQLERLRGAGMPVRTAAPPVALVPWRNRQTGEVVDVPAGIDPGFAYNPGQQRDGALQRAAADAAQGLPPGVRDAAVRDALEPPPGRGRRRRR